MAAPGGPWTYPLKDALAAYPAFQTRVKVLLRSEQLQLRKWWGSNGPDADEARLLYRKFWVAGDFDTDSWLGTTHAVRLRDQPADEAFTNDVLQPRTPYIVISEHETDSAVEDCYIKIRTFDGLEGFIRRKHMRSYKKSTMHEEAEVEDLMREAFAPEMQEEAADENVTWVPDDVLQIRGLTTYAMPQSLKQLLQLRVELLNLDNAWTTGQAFMRDVFKEGRMTSYGARSGREILPESAATQYHPLTEHILRLVSYPMPLCEDPFRKVSVVWNRYKVGDCTAIHKNWVGTKTHMYLHFSEAGATAELAFYKRGLRLQKVQSRILRNEMLFLGAAVGADHLHQITNVKGGRHYSLVVRTITDDWLQWRNYKRGVAPAPPELRRMHRYRGSGPEESVSGGEEEDVESGDELFIIADEMERAAHANADPELRLRRTDVPHSTATPPGSPPQHVSTVLPPVVQAKEE